MANMRVSELVQITVPEITAADLLLISDLTANESKKLTLGDLSTFLVRNGLLTGSFNGTASYAQNAATASFVTVQTASYVPTASWAINSNSSSVSQTATSASYAPTSSWAVTASYALTASVQFVFSASFTDYAKTASYLLYNGNPNGTASYALTASFVPSLQGSSSYASTASIALATATASLALNALTAGTSSFANTASYLAFNGTPNGTASYAVFAGNIANGSRDYGTFYATTQSISSSQLDLVAISPTLGGQQPTNFDIFGTVDVPFTGSAPTNGRIEMFVVNRQFGYSQSLDFSPVYVNIGGNTAISGTFRYPFVLHGESSLFGNYEVYVTASNGVYLDQTRTIRYKITSTSDNLAVSSAEPMIFNTYPVNAIMSYSSSLATAVLQGSASQVVQSGSYDVTALTALPPSVLVMNYTWTLSNLQQLIVDNNSSLTSVGGIPGACITMSAMNCGLTSLPDMSSGSLGYLNVNNNSLTASVNLPASMSYFNIGQNYYFPSLPSTMPYGLIVLVADGTGILTSPASIPNTLVTMSFNTCRNLTSWLSPSLPTSLKYLDTSNSPLSNLPTSMPSPLIYVNVSNDQLPPIIIGNIAQGLVSNGLSNGFLSILNNPNSSSAFNITANIATLQSRGWTVTS